MLKSALEDVFAISASVSVIVISSLHSNTMVGEASSKESTFFENYNETPDGDEETVQISRLPPWFRGDIYLAGMGKFHFEDSGFSVTGLQDGYALLTRVSIPGDGTATVRKKFLQSEAYKKALAAGKTVLSECCTPSSPDVTKSRLGRMMTLVRRNLKKA